MASIHKLWKPCSSLYHRFTIARFLLPPIPCHAEFSFARAVANLLQGRQRRDEGAFRDRHPLLEAWQEEANLGVLFARGYWDER